MRNPKAFIVFTTTLYMTHSELFDLDVFYSYKMAEKSFQKHREDVKTKHYPTSVSTSIFRVYWLSVPLDRLDEFERDTEGVTDAHELFRIFTGYFEGKKDTVDYCDVRV